MEATKAQIESICKGNQKAFRKLVLEYQNMVFTLCMRIIGDQSKAEEATQDVFVKVYKKLNSYNFKASLKTWIYRIAYNTAIDYTRMKDRTGLSIDDTMHQVADKEASIQSKLEKGEQNAYIELCIRKLKKQEAAVISLFYLDEMNVKEIAQTLSLSESNVKVRLFRARKVLASIINKKVVL